ncbi:AzlC family ABC transporter permease [Secundilactobacillus folii]|uniref:Branched-chain amino acid ABC transporter permease n=1 Tax=Secundilactobacillus folii TaxID=2678357 RepID=A0A7X3C477_9LACO|nr:AzlC family ABC transporter permease [Secundilactobacillus folii]MTV83266.1 branched-chain amino acid ABC transporter permease [Secundilactobacillus folii]
MTGDLDAKSALRETLPTVFGYIGIAVAFGITAKANGLSIIEITLLSLLTYAGSVEFVIVSLLAMHAGIWSILLSVFLVNARVILMSTVVAPYLSDETMAKNIWIGTLLTDETFALSMNKLNYTGRKLNFTWFNVSNLAAYATWVVSSALGGILGNLINNPERYGIGFALVAMFIGLLYLQVIADRTIKLNLQLTVIGAVVIMMYLGMTVIPKNGLLLIVTLLGCSIGVVLKHGIK